MILTQPYFVRAAPELLRALHGHATSCAWQSAYSVRPPVAPRPHPPAPGVDSAVAPLRCISFRCPPPRRILLIPSASCPGLRPGIPTQALGHPPQDLPRALRDAESSITGCRTGCGSATAPRWSRASSLHCVPLVPVLASALSLVQLWPPPVDNRSMSGGFRFPRNPSRRKIPFAHFPPTRFPRQSLEPPGASKADSISPPKIGSLFGYPAQHFRERFVVSRKR